MSSNPTLDSDAEPTIDDYFETLYAVYGRAELLVSAHKAVSQRTKERERVARIDELEGLSVGVDDQCADEWRDRLQTLTKEEKNDG